MLVKEKEPAVPRAPDSGPGCTLANMLDTTQLLSLQWAKALIKRRATKARPPENLSVSPQQAQLNTETRCSSRLDRDEKLSALFY